MAFDRYALTEMRAPDSTLLRSGKRLGGGGGGGDGDGDGDDCAAAANDRTVRTNAPRIVQVRADFGMPNRFSKLVLETLFDIHAPTS